MAKKGTHDGLAARLRELREHFRGGQTQQGMAKLLQIDQQRWSSYEQGTKVPHPVLAGLVRLGVNPEWLLLGEGPMMRESVEAERIRRLQLSLPPAVAEAGEAYGGRPAAAEAALGERLSDFYVLPLYADEAAAGEPIEMRDQEIEGPAVIHRNWCPHPERTDYVRIAATGTSMEPTIPAGAIITIDRSVTEPEPLLGKVVALGLRDDGVTVKRLRRTERGGYIGVPDNPDPAHRTLYLEEGDRIIGQVNTVHAWLG
jgi:phage repressor protein C with HTH and peptisase S24 domain